MTKTTDGTTFSASYDAASNLAALTEPGGTTAYAYWRRRHRGCLLDELLMEAPHAQVQLKSARRLMVLIAAVWAIAMVAGLVAGEVRLLVIATFVAAWAEGVAILSSLSATGKLSRGHARVGRVILALLFATVGAIVSGLTN